MIILVHWRSKFSFGEGVEYFRGIDFGLRCFSMIIDKNFPERVFVVSFVVRFRDLNFFLLVGRLLNVILSYLIIISARKMQGVLH